MDSITSGSLDHTCTGKLPKKEKSPRGDKKKKDVPLKTNNGTREGLPATFNKETDKIIPRGIKSEQITGSLDHTCTGKLPT